MNLAEEYQKRLRQIQNVVDESKGQDDFSMDLSYLNDQLRQRVKNKNRKQTRAKPPPKIELTRGMRYDVAELIVDEAELSQHNIQP